MTLSLYKPATKENHKYETEGVFYFYEVCEESEIDKYLSDGWVTEFSKLKGLQNEEENKKTTKATEVLTKQRGRPRAQ